MAEPRDTRRDLRYIRWLWRNTKEPFRRVTEWAKQRNRIRRFSSAQKWARQMQEAAQRAKARAKFKAFRGRMRKKVEWLENNKDPEPSTASGVGTFDGKQVANWIIPWLEKSRRAGWRGYVVSGYRSPSYSTSLCYAMCGAPSCPGRCAGANSNHAGSSYPGGAIDVTDYYNFAVVQRQIGSPLQNRIGPSDLVHFSHNGY
jgi:hypothetical protein